MKLNRILLIALAGAAANANALSQGSIAVYTDRAAWEAAVAEPFAEEKFNDPIPYWFRVQLHSPYVPGAGTASGAMQALAASSSEDVISFDGGIRAFGGDWDLQVGTRGIGLVLIVQDSNDSSKNLRLSPEIDRNSAGGFFGFVAPYAITSSVRITGGTQGGPLANSEGYRLDNVVFVSSDQLAPPQPPPPPPVPEPGTAGLMILGTGLLSLWGRRRTFGMWRR